MIDHFRFYGRYLIEKRVVVMFEVHDFQRFRTGHGGTAYGVLEDERHLLL